MAEKREDPWVETLRKTREASQRIRERLEESQPEPKPVPGIPCE